MSESDMAIIKPEVMKSYIWLQTADGSIQQVEEEVAMFCPMICREVIQTGMGSSKNFAIALPQRVNPAILSLILDYCRFHQLPGRSNKERKSFDEKFIRIDTKRLCELTSAADSLQLKPLVDLTSRALARMIEGKTPEEIRETFHLPDDLTEEEKLEPLKNTADDPRIRLLNRLYARKRKELKEKEKLKNVEIEEERIDERSVDDLLSFINGGDGGSKASRTTKHKKKSRRRKDQGKDSSLNSIKNNCGKEASSTKAGTTCPNNKNSKSQECSHDPFMEKVDFDDVDIDDGLDPAMKEQLDREVEDFAKRLNSVWPERMQQIFSGLNGNGSLHRYSEVLPLVGADCRSLHLGVMSIYGVNGARVRHGHMRMDKHMVHIKMDGYGHALSASVSLHLHPYVHPLWTAVENPLGEDCKDHIPHLMPSSLPIALQIPPFPICMTFVLHQFSSPDFFSSAK